MLLHLLAFILILIIALALAVVIALALTFELVLELRHRRDNCLFIKMFIALVVEQTQFSINDLQQRQAKLLI